MDVFKTLILDTPDSLENISGVLPVVNGGTGADNAPDARVNLLPNYTGNANKVLSLNGTATDVEWTSNGAGDVAGPASSTDNAVARFDSTTGKLIQNSGVSISDANLLTTTALTVNDNTTLGSSNTDTVNFNARVASDINPSADDTYDLGVTGHEWRNLNIDGTANIDSLVADTADVNGGTIDGATIGATTPSTGAFTTLGATGVLTITKATGAQTVANTSGNTTGTYQSFGTSTGTKGYIGLGDQLVSGGSVNDVGIDGFAGNVIFTTASVTRATVTSTGLNSTAIGATTPSTGAFTTLSASSAITNTLAGGSLSFNSVSGNTAGTYNQFTTSAGAKIYYGIGSQIIGGATVNDFVLDSISGNVIISTAETARATFSSTGLAVTGAISVNNTAITTSSTVSSFLTPNLVNANRSALFVGRSFASNDAAYIGYTPESTSSLSQLNLGFFGANNLVNITAAGNVGISTSSPARKLVVASSAAMKLSTAQGALFSDTANDGGVIIGSDFAIGSIQGSNAAGTSAKNLMLQAEGGNVGIGTSSPGALLDVTKNQAAATAINVLNPNSSGSASARIRVGYDASNCYDIFRVGNSADIIQNATQALANIIWQTAGTERLRITSTGLDVTGALSATGAITATSAGAFIANTGASASSKYIQLANTAGNAEVGVLAAGQAFLYGSQDTLIYGDGAIVGTFSSTGLAVTGALSTTGNLTLTGNNGTITFSGTGYGAIGGGISTLYLNAGSTVYIGPSNVGAFYTGGLSVTGAITATGNITAYYSDDRLKTKLGNIENALDKVSKLNGFYYEANETAQALGYKPVREVGLSAQQVEAVLPEVVAPAPIDNEYKTLHYERVIPLLVEAIKELKAEIELLKK